jgi:hypothetical protein
MKTKILLIPMITGLFISHSSGQIQLRRLQTEMTAGAGISFETWKAKNDKVTELAIPIVFIYPYSPKLSLYAITSPVVSNLNAGENYSLSGLSDVKWGGHYLTLGDKLLLTFGINLPTGKHALETEEYAVATVLSMPAFNFRVPSLGQGLDFQLGANSAREFGDWVVGYGATFLMKGAFKPFKGFDDAYNPGDEITLAAGADRKTVLFGKEMQIKGDALVTLYFDDTWGGKKVFRSGNRILLQILSTFKHRSWDVGLFVRERMKGKNKTGSGDIYETEQKNSNANQFEIQGWGFYPYSRDVRLKAAFEMKLYSDSDYNTGGATLLGVGGGGQFRISPKMVLNGDLRLYFGKIKSGAEKINTTGIKLYGGIEYTL